MTINWQTLRTATDILNQYKQTKLHWLNAERDRLIAAGIEHAGHRYQTSERNIADLMGAVQVAQLAQIAGQEFTTQWLTEDNVTVTMTLHDLAALGAAVAQHKAYLVYKCREHKDALALLTTQQAVDTYLNTLQW